MGKHTTAEKHILLLETVLNNIETYFGEQLKIDFG